MPYLTTDRWRLELRSTCRMTFQKESQSPSLQTLWLLDQTSFTKDTQDSLKQFVYRGPPGRPKFVEQEVEVLQYRIETFALFLKRYWLWCKLRCIYHWSLHSLCIQLDSKHCFCTTWLNHDDDHGVLPQQESQCRNWVEGSNFYSFRSSISPRAWFAS